MATPIVLDGKTIGAVGVDLRYKADRDYHRTVKFLGVVGSLITGDVIYWGGLMAGALVAALPPLVVYAFLMDYYVSGLTAGATKG